MNEQLRKLQLTQLEILKAVDQFCISNHIRYSLYAGTLLGAVRHRGFIPWDDDLDICMARADYDRFIYLWTKTEHPGYVLMNKENSPAFSQSFTKIRKDHTTFLQSESEVGKYHTGIFVDIFPIDRMPKGKYSRKVFRLRCMLYQLFTREFPPSRDGFVNKAGSKIILAFVPKAKRANCRKKLLKKITAYNNQSNLETVAIETVASLKKPFSCDMLDSYTTLRFEDGEYMCFAGWDDHLHRKFGDYMTLPPESERIWKHHPLIVDFNYNYEELPQSRKI